MIDFNDAFYNFNMTGKWYPLNQKKGSVLTQINNEFNFFPIWLDYYSKFYEPEDIYVLNHKPSDEFNSYLKSKSIEKKFNIIPVHNQNWFSSVWMCMNYSLFQRFLLQSYESVLCCDCDEIVYVNPLSYYGNLKNYYENFTYAAVATNGFHVCSNPLIDSPIDSTKPILQQRSRWSYDEFMHKPLLSKIPLDYNIGQHSVNNINVIVDPDLIMFHLHYIDIDWIVEKNNNRKLEDWEKLDVEHGFTKHNLPSEKKDKISEFLTYYNTSVEIPHHFKTAI